jgi:hypothetical protein
MIVSRVCCGLGNQLFQYAAARSLAHRHGVDVFVDVSWFDAPPANSTPRSFSLSNTKAKAVPLTSFDQLRTRIAVVMAGIPCASRFVARVQRTATGFAVYSEPQSGDHPALLRQPKNTILIGFWQSETYFFGIRRILKKEIVPRIPLTGRAAEMAHRIDRLEDSVGIQVRRGDFVSSANGALVHGACPRSYYETAAKQILENHPKARFFVFSDDPEWCRDELELPGSVEIVSDGRAATDVIDLHLLARCRHHVISNSTFGWWGAWLGETPTGITVCPLRWLNDESMDTGNLVPERWRRL